MTDMPPPQPPDPDDTPPAPDMDHRVWDPGQVLRERSEATRRRREQAIANLRAQMSDQEILEEFGINLGEIER